MKYGRLTPLEKVGAKQRDSLWKCACDCGKSTVVRISQLRSGKTKSCGCLRSETTAEKNRTHGKSNTREYRVWQSMHRRCGNPKDSAFKNYGGRGIAICERWKNFENFIADMGTAPPGCSIERKDNSGNYEPSNCIWTTRYQQSRNTRRTRFATINGRTMCMRDWAKELGIKYYTLMGRLNRYHWPIEKALGL